MDSLPDEDFDIPEEEHPRKRSKRKVKKHTSHIVEPASTVALPTEQLRAVVDMDVFHPGSKSAPLLGVDDVGPEEFLGQEMCREEVINVLAASGLTADLRHNARTYGNIEEVDASLAARRRWRMCYGTIDGASKYDVDNRCGEVDTTSTKFRDIGKGVFYGVRDGSHHSDEFLDIVKCYDIATTEEDTIASHGYYNQGDVHEWREHDLDPDLAIYIDVSAGKMSGRGGGIVPNPKLDATISDMVGAGRRVESAFHKDAVFEEGVGVHDHWKNLKHNEEVIGIFCLDDGCENQVYYDTGPPNLLRDRKIFNRQLQSGGHANYTPNFRQRKGRACPPKITRPWDYVDRLKHRTGTRKKVWEKYAMGSIKPPPPTTPIMTDMNWRIARNKIPEGGLLRSFSSFVWDPRFSARFDEKHGWVRTKIKFDQGEEHRYEAPTLEQYLDWALADPDGF